MEPPISLFKITLLALAISISIYAVLALLVYAAM
jgi:type II secretory pathway component PulJ